MVPLENRKGTRMISGNLKTPTLEERKEEILEKASRENPPNWWERATTPFAMILSFVIGVGVVLMSMYMSLPDLSWYWVPAVIICLVAWVLFWAGIVPEQSTGRPEWCAHDVELMDEEDVPRYVLGQIRTLVSGFRKEHPGSEFELWQLTVRRKIYGAWEDSDLFFILAVKRKEFFKDLPEPEIVWEEAY